MRSKLNILFIALLLFSSCKVGRFFIYNFADIKDYKKFPERDLVRATEPFFFAEKDSAKKPTSLTLNGEKVDFEEYLENNETVAFIIIKNDTIQYEKYLNGYSRNSIVPSFSMAKSFTSLLVGFAIQDGLIESVKEPVTNYIPEMKVNGFDQVTIEHVLQMTSGIEFNESYTNPFGHAATFYYGRKLESAVQKLKLQQAPGTVFDYQSGQTQILGLILHRVLAKEDKTITSYFQEKIWTPLGMEYDGSWSLDKKGGLEKTFCCVNARAIDFAKIGRLMLHKGNWNGKQLLNEAWIDRSLAIDTTAGSVWYYQYQWWLEDKEGNFSAQGILGQHIFVNPSTGVIIVRLGESR